MYTLDNANRKRMAAAGFADLLAAAFCALFGAVYEQFSHGVYSGCMVYAFLFPLAGGALPCLALALFSKKGVCRWSMNLYHAGIAAWTAGSILKGVLDIYGTTNAQAGAYWPAGAVFVLAGAAVEWKTRKNFRQSSEN